MKKLLFSFLVVFTFVLGISEVSAKEEVTIYLFRGITCEHCEEALTYINNHKDEIPEGVKFLSYETWENANNAKLLESVAEKVGVPEKNRTSVPLFVIGDQYVIGYSGLSSFNKVMDIARSYVDNDEYKDVVDETIKELNIDVKSMKLEDIFSEPNKVVTIVVYSIFGVIVLGFGAMIIFSRKK